jgi:hypothetical protein
MLGAILPLPQYVFMTWCLVKHRDNFTFYLYSAKWKSMSVIIAVIIIIIIIIMMNCERLTFL